jgi:hypothetical protein
VVLLRESSRVLGQEIDVDAVVDSTRRVPGGAYGFPAAAELLAFASAANRVANPAMAGDVATDDAGAAAILSEARANLLAAVGREGLLEAAATVAAFNGLVRVADGTGIELDDAMIVVSAGVRSSLGLDAMAGAANTRRLGAAPVTDVAPEGSAGRVRSLFADAE